MEVKEIEELTWKAVRKETKKANTNNLHYHQVMKDLKIEVM